MAKVALITGVTGQDGYYLAKLLNANNYAVHGLVRRTAGRHAERELVFEYLDRRIPGDITDFGTITRIFNQTTYDEVYHLAAQSFVAESFDDPFSAWHINTIGTLNVLEAIKHFAPDCKLYNAASSEMFGNEHAPQGINTPLMPRSPYGVSKLAAYQLVKNYREAYDLFACSGILFNHESPIRGEQFVTRKIIKAVVAIEKKRQDTLYLGNLNALRDWGHAEDYVQAMHMMLQRSSPKDFVIGTGKAHSIREFCAQAFAHFGRNYENFVTVAAKYYRPADVNHLQADIQPALFDLGWQPTHTLKTLIADMITYEWNNS